MPLLNTHYPHLYPARLANLQAGQGSLPYKGLKKVKTPKAHRDCPNEGVGGGRGGVLDIMRDRSRMTINGGELCVLVEWIPEAMLLHFPH